MATEQDLSLPLTEPNSPSPLYLARTLIVFGVLLVLFAEALGKIPAARVTPGMTWTDSETAKFWTLKIYLLGGLSIFVGLIERIVVAFAPPANH